MDTQRNAMSEKEIIEQAVKAFREESLIDHPVLASLEAFYMNGSADEVDGDMETFGHFYRVHRWIVWTDSPGFHELETYDTEADAINAFEGHQRDYVKAQDDGEVD